MMSAFFPIVLLASCFVVTAVLSVTMTLPGHMPDEWARRIADGRGWDPRNGTILGASRVWA